MADLIKYAPIFEQVKTYETARQEVIAGFALLKSAKIKTEGLWDQALRDYDMDDNAKKSLKYIKRKLWTQIIEKTEIKNLLTQTREKELWNDLDSDSLPEPTLENIQGFISAQHSNLPNYFDELMRDVFSALRPRRSKYKTNTEFEIKEKAIIEHMIESDHGFIRLNYYRENFLNNLDNVFHLLDGKGPVKYPDTLYTALRQAIQDKNQELETEYFKTRWYLKGTLHITFKRIDLVKELNKRMGGNKLKQ